MRRNPGSGKNIFQLACAYYRVHFRNIFADLITKAFHQTSRNNQLARLARFVPSHLQDRIDRFLLRTFDE